MSGNDQSSKQQEPGQAQQQAQQQSQEPAQQQQQQQAQEPQQTHANEAEPAQQQQQQQAQPAPGSTVNRSKYERDVAKKQAEIDSLSKELEGYKGLKEEFDAWKSQQESEKQKEALESAGCHDIVAAAARLAEFDGDIDKLKEAAPYLFTSSDNSKATGGAQKGAPDPEDERTKRMRKTMGLDTETE